MRKTVQLGIDYGTSFSKMIFRDYDAPGGEQAFIIQDDEGDYRFPSTVFFDQDNGSFYFGLKDWKGQLHNGIVRYGSVKMRIAEEVKNTENAYFFGEKFLFPENIKAVDLATLTLWHLLTIAESKISHYFGSKDFNVEITMGIPMSFYNDSDLKLEFLTVVRAGQWLYQNYGSMPYRDPIDLSKTQSAIAAAKKGIHSISAMSEEDVRSWLRTEAESALLWAYNSPKVGDGLYAKVDVGAGTTNSSLFTVKTAFNDELKRETKSGMAFFHANSISIGMDAIGVAIQKDKKSGKQLSYIRGKENEYINTITIDDKTILKTYDKIYTGFQSAWQKSYGKYPDHSAWKELKMFVFGGGGLVYTLVEKLRRHPDKNCPHWTDGLDWPIIPFVPLEVPNDLVFLKDREKPSRDDLYFLLVSYGLSNNYLSIPEIRTPRDIIYVPPIRRKVRYIEDHELIR